MNYKKIYDALISKRKANPPDTAVYCEKHHIIPRCLGGLDEKENLVVLTYREHFIAHCLLCRIYKENTMLLYSLYMMSLNQSNKNRTLRMNEYAIAKKALKDAAKTRAKTFHPGKTKKSREKARERMLTKNPIREIPHKNHTAYPVEVLYEDGSVVIYECAAYIPIPYQTVKWLRKHDCGSKKHGIVKITPLNLEKQKENKERWQTN